MADKLGEFEVNVVDNFVRLEVDQGEYEYLISAEKDGNQAHSKVLLFKYAYNQGKLEARRKLKKLVDFES